MSSLATGVSPGSSGIGSHPIKGNLIMGNGSVFATGVCHSCRSFITFNPHKVPSVRDGAGRRQPLCQQCVGVINTEGIRRGDTLFVIPEGAYESMKAEEL